MRTKVDPHQVHFPGTNAPPISLPRSLAHPSRLPPGALQQQQQQHLQQQQHQASRPTYTNPGQMHVIQQQQLQDQLQARGPTPNSGMPPGGMRLSLQQQQQQQQQHQQHQQMQQQQQFHPPPPPSTPGPQQMHSQYPQSQPPTPQQQQNQYAPNSQQPPGPQSYQQQQGYHQPSRPSSAQSSPHLAHTPHPFANKPPGPNGGGPNGQLQGRDPNHGMQISPAFMQALATIGLGGRDPESLSAEEHVSFFSI